MTVQIKLLLLAGVTAVFAGCGGGGSSGPAAETGSLTEAGLPVGVVQDGSSPGGSGSETNSANDPLAPTDTGSPDTGNLSEDDPDGADSAGTVGFDVMSQQATYQVTVRNFWGVEDFPQDFPDAAHLSLWGGATHNSAVSFWSVGEPPSRGLEDVAEAGLIDILLFDEVAPAITQGTAGSMIEVREFTGPQINGEPGILQFEITVSQAYSLVSMVSMLGPSPDWIVGVNALSLQTDADEDGVGDGVWLDSLTVGSPLYDGGSKSDVTPIMGGPDIIPPDPIGLVAYDQATGVYLPTGVPQIVAELQFDRIR